MTPLVHRGLEDSEAFVRLFLAGIPADRVLLVCRPDSFSRSGAADWLRHILPSPPPIFSDFSSNPTVEEATRGLDLFHRIHADAVMAIGGGSVMDMAKMINFLGTRNLSFVEYLNHPAANPLPLKPLLAVPTTAGSGSEATRFAVAYRGPIKHSISDLAVRPTHVLLVPEFTASASPHQTACSGLDALAQGIESFWARDATRESRQWARESVHLAFHHLVPAVRQPSPLHRTAMLDSSHLAGRAIDVSKTTGPHAFSYALTALYGLPHGHAVGLLLPFFLDHHQRAGIETIGPNATELRRMMSLIGLDRSVPASADELALVFTRHVNAERLANNPVPVDDAFIRFMARGLTHVLPQPPPP